MNQLPRIQHIITSALVAAIGFWVAFISFTAQPEEAFVFPRIISLIFAALALWTFVKAILGRSRVGNGLSMPAMKNIFPGLFISLICVFWAAKGLGFYTATTAAFFILYSIYDPAPHGRMKTWLKRVFMTIGFIMVMYALFSVLLNVYTPKEVFF